MSASFTDCVKNGWLVAHKSSKQEIANLLGIVARAPKHSQAKDVSRSNYILTLVTQNSASDIKTARREYLRSSLISMRLTFNTYERIVRL
jgi:hypothetical protein